MRRPSGASRGVPLLDPVESDPDLPREVDVVVVGGGIVGSAAAWYLAGQGLKVLLCEKGRIGAEQSSRNWGWVRQMGRDPAEMPLTIESLRIWRGLRDQGIETGFSETGITYVASKDHERLSFDDWEAQGRAHGLPVRRLRGSDVTNLLPGIAERYVEGLHTGNDGRAEPGLAAPAFAKAARARGATLVTGCAVRGLDLAAGRVTGVVTERGRVTCDRVLFAGGAWARLFLGNLGLRFPQLRIVGTAARVETSAALPLMPVGTGDFAVRARADGGYNIARRNANVAPFTPDSFRFFGDFVPTYLKTWRELKLRVTPMSWAEARTKRRWALDEVSPFEACRVLDPDPDPGYVRDALAGLGRVFPQAQDARLTHAWAGVIDATPDGVPAIGPVPGLPGLFLASGFSGHGFGIGPGAGRLAADLVAGTTPLVDPAPFRVSRFELGARAAAERVDQLHEVS